MRPEKCAQIIRLVKEARSITADLLFSPNSHTAVSKAILLALLYRIQAMAVSLQSDLLEPSGNTEAIEEPVLPLEGPAEKEPARRGAGQPKAGLRCKVIPFNRRRLKQDRRRMPTYIACDRRSGLVDRRRRRQAQPASL